MGKISIDQARTAKTKAAEIYRPLGTMVAVGLTSNEDGYAVKVNLSRALPADTHFPTRIDNVPVKVEVVGVIKRL